MCVDRLIKNRGRVNCQASGVMRAYWRNYHKNKESRKQEALDNLPVKNSYMENGVKVLVLEPRYARGILPPRSKEYCNKNRA